MPQSLRILVLRYKGGRNMNSLVIKNLPELPFAVEEAINQLRVNLGFCGDQIKTVMIH